MLGSVDLGDAVLRNGVVYHQRGFVNGPLVTNRQPAAYLEEVRKTCSPGHFR